MTLEGTVTIPLSRYHELLDKPKDGYELGRIIFDHWIKLLKDFGGNVDTRGYTYEDFVKNNTEIKNLLCL